MAWHRQSDDIWSDGKLSLSQILAGRGGQLKDWASAPNQLVRFSGGEQEGGLHVAKAGNSHLRQGIRRRKWLINEGSNPANDQVPVVVHFHRNHRLDIYYILRTISGIDPAIVVVLNRDADEAGDRVLGSFS